MKKVMAVIIFFVLIISIFLIKMQAASYSPEKVLMKAFDSSEATIAGSELYLRGKLDGKISKDTGCYKELIGVVAGSIGGKAVEDGYRIIDTDGSQGVETDINLSEGRSLHAGIVNDRRDASRNAYIYASVSNPAGAPNLANTRVSLEKALNAFGIKPEFNSCITGTFEGKTGNSELNAACARIFASADARKVEGIREGGLISVSAFSNDIREYVNDNGSRVNLNLAFRYNSYEKKTYIWLATPVITTEY